METSPENTPNSNEQKSDEPINEKGIGPVADKDAREHFIYLTKENDLSPSKGEIPSPIESDFNVEGRIEKLMQEMDFLNEEAWSLEELETQGTLYSRVSEAMRDEWYWVENEAIAGKDRGQATEKLENFIVKLRQEVERIKQK